MTTISLINMKGGVGKTTMAVNIADSLHTRQRKKVLLIDVDPQFNATQCVMSTDKYIRHIKSNGVTIVDVFNSSARPVPSVTRGATITKPLELGDIKPIKTERGFDLIPGDLELFKLEMASGQGRENRLKRYLEIVQANYDYVIIDSPPTPSVWMSSALIASNFYLIPVKADPLSITGVDLLQGVISEKKSNYGFECKCCGIVITMVDRRSRAFVDAKKYFDSTKQWKNMVYQKRLLTRVSVARSQAKNKYIFDIEDSDLKSEFSGIIAELESRVKNEY